MKSAALKTFGLIMAASVVASSAWAQEKVTLKFADWMPISHYVVPEGMEPWIDEIKSASEGTIDIEYYPAQQLGKASEYVTLAQSGVADIVHISPAYISDKFPLSGVSELPGLFLEACTGTRALTSMLQEGALLNEAEFAPQGLRVLWAFNYSPYVIMTNPKKVETLDDLQGLKLRTVGGAMDITTTEMGAVAVNMTGPDVLPSLQRGTLDGMLVPLLALHAFDWQTALKYMTTNVATANFSSVLAISEAAWTKLTPEQQTVLTQTSADASQRICAYIDEANSRIIEQLKEEDGIEEVIMSDEELEKLDVALAAARTKWAERIDGIGKPGTQALEEFLAAVGSGR